MDFSDHFPPDTGPSHPRKEKTLAIFGAIGGALLGALLFGLIFMVPTLFFTFPYERLIVIFGIAMGVVHGAGIGSFIMLRFSRKFGVSYGHKVDRRHHSDRSPIFH